MGVHPHHDECPKALSFSFKLLSSTQTHSQTQSESVCLTPLTLHRKNSSSVRYVHYATCTTSCVRNLITGNLGDAPWDMTAWSLWLTCVWVWVCICVPIKSNEGTPLSSMSFKPRNVGVTGPEQDQTAEQEQHVSIWKLDTNYQNKCVFLAVYPSSLRKLWCRIQYHVVDSFTGGMWQVFSCTQK